VNIDDSNDDDAGADAVETTVDAPPSSDSAPTNDSVTTTDSGLEGEDSAEDSRADDDTGPPPVDASTCPGTTCGSRCVDMATDPLHCGACGAAVCALEICRGGAPKCAPGYESCGGSGSACLGCKNLKSDPDNCGGCGNRCDPATGQLCVDGACTFSFTGTCPSPLKQCLTSTTFGIAGCFDVDADVGHCGGCDVSCSPAQYCRGGKCIDYASAPGCTSCPCAACAGETSHCCTSAGATICAAACG